MASSANQLISRADDCRNGLPVASAQHLYEGCMSFVKTNGFAEGTTGSGANAFAGINVTEVDNSGGNNGDLNVEVFTDGKFQLPGSGFSQASVGQRVFATDNNTVTTDSTAANAVYIGECRGFISSTVIVVAIDVAPPKFGVYTQTYNTALRTVPNATVVAVATTASSQSTPWGFSTQAQADSIPVNINALAADVLALKKVLTAVIDDLQAAGISG